MIPNGCFRALTKEGVLSEDQLVRAASPTKTDEMFLLAEQITKGPEHCLPAGYSFLDKDGTERREIRLQWWNAAALCWRDAAISVPNVNDLPEQDLPQTLMSLTYPISERPVFFGHYWLTGNPVLQANNALCLDYSAGKDGPLVTYEISDPSEPLSLGNVRVHPGIATE